MVLKPRESLSSGPVLALDEVGVVVPDREATRMGKGRHAAVRGGLRRGRTVGFSVAVIAGVVGTVAGFKLAEEESTQRPDGLIVHTVPEQTEEGSEFWTEERMRQAEGL